MSILENTTNLRRQENIDKYLYEIIEDYKDSTLDGEKSEIFNSFCSSIWSSDNKRRIYTKTIRFNVRKNLLDTDIGQVFDTWSEVEYKGYKAMSMETDWCSLIRQKVNNLYTRYFDEEVILRKEYMDLIKTPKNLYFSWIAGQEMDADELTTIIDNAIDNSEKVKVTYKKQKMDLLWNDYIIIINGFFQKIFNNAKKIDEYEDKTVIVNMYDFINEDNFYIKYFCKGLEGMMRDYQKRYYGLPQSTRMSYTRCQFCGKLIKKTGKNHKYCDGCKREKQLIWQRNSMKKSRNKPCEVL